MSTERYQVEFDSHLCIWEIKDTKSGAIVDGWNFRKDASTACEQFNNGTHPRSEVQRDFIQSVFEDAKELIRYWVQMRDYIELREELSDQLDALAKKLGY